MSWLLNWSSRPRQRTHRIFVMVAIVSGGILTIQDIFRSMVNQVLNRSSVHFQSKPQHGIWGWLFKGQLQLGDQTQDHSILHGTARHLSLESRAHILPEEQLEAMLLLGDQIAVKQLVRDEKPGIAEQRAVYLYSLAPTRNPGLVEELQRIYEGRCQICLWHPRQDYHYSLCQAHHIQWLSRGGEDELTNMVLICPNHHAAIHRVDAPLDFRDLSFNFGTRQEKIMVNNHLQI